MSWSKLHSDEWLYGSIRKYPPEIRGIWPDLQALAEVSPMTGFVCVAPGIGYGNEQLAKVLNCGLDLLLKSMTIFISEKYIKVDENNVIAVLDWKWYQSEYQRLRKYKEGTKKGTSKSTPKSTKKYTEKGTNTGEPPFPPLNNPPLIPNQSQNQSQIYNQPEPTPAFGGHKKVEPENKNTAFIINGERITWAYRQSVLNRVKDIYIMGRIFYRAHIKARQGGIIAWIEEGLKGPNNYALLPIEEESISVGVIQNWIDKNILKYKNDGTQTIGEILSLIPDKSEQNRR
jgi:hypothetical protein